MRAPRFAAEELRLPLADALLLLDALAPAFVPDGVRFAPAAEFRAAEDAEVRFAPLPLPFLPLPDVRPLPLRLRDCSISKLVNSRALRSTLMNSNHSMFPV